MLRVHSPFQLVARKSVTHLFCICFVCHLSFFLTIAVLDFLKPLQFFVLVVGTRMWLVADLPFPLELWRSVVLLGFWCCRLPPVHLPSSDGIFPSDTGTQGSPWDGWCFRALARVSASCVPAWRMHWCGADFVHRLPAWPCAVFRSFFMASSSKGRSLATSCRARLKVVALPRLCCRRPSGRCPREAWRPRALCRRLCRGSMLDPPAAPGLSARVSADCPPAWPCASDRGGLRALPPAWLRALRWGFSIVQGPVWRSWPSAVRFERPSGLRPRVAWRPRASAL